MPETFEQPNPKPEEPKSSLTPEASSGTDVGDEGVADSTKRSRKESREARDEVRDMILDRNYDQATALAEHKGLSRVFLSEAFRDEAVLLILAGAWNLAFGMIRAGYLDQASLRSAKLINALRDSADLENIKAFSAIAGVPLEKIITKETAIRMIRMSVYGIEEYINFHIDQLGNLDEDFANKLIETGQAQLVSSRLDKFQGLDHREVAQKMIAAGRCWAVVEDLDKFQGLDHREVAQKIIAAGDGRFVAKNLNKFNGLDEEIARKLIDGSGEKGWDYHVAENLDKFQGLGPEIAQVLVDRGYSRQVVQNLDKFQDLDPKEFLTKLVESGDDFALVYNLDKFPDLDHKKIVRRLLKKGDGALVAENLGKIRCLDEETAIGLIEIKQGWAVVQNLDKFQGIDHREVASKLVGVGHGCYVAGHLDKFQLDSNDVAEIFLPDLPEEMRSHVSPYFSEWMGFVRPTFVQFLDELKALSPLVSERPEIVAEVLDPTIKSQGIGAFRVLEKLRPILESDAIVNAEDRLLLKHVTTSMGVRGADTLDFIRNGVFGECGDRRFVDDEGQNVGWGADADFSNSREMRGPFLETPLSANPSLRSFLDSRLPMIDDLYRDYASIMENPDLSPSERQAAIGGLNERVKRLAERIRSGGMAESELRDDTFIGMTYHAFPPATTLDRGQYRNLLARREDRQDDLPPEWAGLNASPAARLKTVSGAWVLKEGERSDASAWNALSEAIRSGNASEIRKWNGEAAALAGGRLVEALGDQKRMNKSRSALLKEIYDFHRSANGATLTTDISSREGLLELKEYAADRMKDTVDLLLKAYAKSDPEGYEQAVKKATEITIKEKAKKGIAKQMLGILGAISMDAEDTNQKLKAVLGRYGIHAEGDVLGEALKAVESISDDDDAAQRRAVETFLKDLLDGAAMRRNAGKLSVDISNRLLGDDYAAMQNEMGKYEFVEGAEGGEADTFQLEVSKHRAHAATGLNMGVCVAVDEGLWNKETFSNVILWDKDNIARGGMHFEIVEDGEKKYLSLPGINPSNSAIGQVGAGKLLDAMLEYAKEAARRIGAEAVLVPTSSVIHSNRAEIQGALASKGFKTLSLEKGSHQFSYDPYEYEWADAYVIEV